MSRTRKRRRNVDRDYSLVTHISQRLEDHGDGDWDEYVVEINGTIGYLDISDEGVEDAEGVAGRVTAYLLRIGASLDDGQPADSVFDAHSAEVYEAFETIIDPSTMDIRDAVQKTLGGLEAWVDDVLFVDKMELLPEHRGQGLGLLTMRRLLGLYGLFCSFAVAKPFPMYPKVRKNTHGCGDPDWFKAMDYKRFKATDTVAARKLSRLWGKVGFRQIPDSNWYVWYRFPDDPASRR